MELPADEIPAPGAPAPVARSVWPDPGPVIDLTETPTTPPASPAYGPRATSPYGAASGGPASRWSPPPEPSPFPRAYVPLVDPPSPELPSVPEPTGWSPDALVPTRLPEGDPLVLPVPEATEAAAGGPGPSSSRHRLPGGTRRAFLLGAAAIALGGGGTVLVRRLRTVPPPARLALATGPRGAVFLGVGEDVARAIEARYPGTQVSVRITAATVENLRLLFTGQADLGFASLDAAVTDLQVRDRAITALSRIYDSYLQLVVPARSLIRSLRDVDGRVVSIGASGSGTEFTALRLLETVGIQPGRVLRLGQTQAMQAVAEGTVDGAFSLTGVPTPAITELANRQAVRLVPLGEYFGSLDRSIPRSYQPALILPGSYRGQTGPVDTVLVPNVLLARPGLGAAAVDAVMDALFAGASRPYWKQPESRQLSRELAIATGAATLHPAAKAWLDANPA